MPAGAQVPALGAGSAAGGRAVRTRTSGVRRAAGRPRPTAGVKTRTSSEVGWQEQQLLPEGTAALQVRGRGGRG